MPATMDLQTKPLDALVITTLIDCWSRLQAQVLTDCLLKMADPSVAITGEDETPSCTIAAVAVLGNCWVNQALDGTWEIGKQGYPLPTLTRLSQTSLDYWLRAEAQCIWRDRDIRL